MISSFSITNYCLITDYEYVRQCDHSSDFVINRQYFVMWLSTMLDCSIKEHKCNSKLLLRYYDILIASSIINIHFRKTHKRFGCTLNNTRDDETESIPNIKCPGLEGYYKNDHLFRMVCNSKAYTIKYLVWVTWAKLDYVVMA